MKKNRIALQLLHMIKQTFIFWLVFVITLGVSCGSLFDCINLKPKENASVSLKEMVLETVDDAITFKIELAQTKKQRALGLMGRKKLMADHGMLFVFEKKGRNIFYMKNTYVPLDLIFFDDQWQVIGIVENTRPLSLQKLDIKKDSRYVLEVLAGTVKRKGINLKTKARLLKN